MTPFKSIDGKTFKCRVYDSTGAGYVRTLGTRDEDEADEFERLLGRFRRQRRWEVLDLIIARRLTVAEVFDGDADGTLHVLLARVRQEEKAQAAAERDPDLSPMVAEWAAAGADDRYVRQVRRLIPEGERFALSSFRRKVIGEFLAGLTNLRRESSTRSTVETRKRYRVALSGFAKFLIERELLETNPVRDVALARRTKPRPIVFLESADVKRLALALPEPYRALEALMAGTGMEWGAVAACKREDVDLEARLVHARGSKNQYRDRWVEVSEPWAWTIVERHVRSVSAGELLFSITERDALREHHAAAERLGLRRTVLHTHRHSYSVMWIRRSKGDASKLAWLKNQLGHAPQSMLIFTTYGVEIRAARLSVQQAERLAGEATAADARARKRVGGGSKVTNRVTRREK